jgi:hypothetical protein
MTHKDNSVDSVHKYITVVDLALFVVGFLEEKTSSTHNYVKEKLINKERKSSEMKTRKKRDPTNIDKR